MTDKVKRVQRVVANLSILRHGHPFGPVGREDVLVMADMRRPVVLGCLMSLKNDGLVVFEKGTVCIPETSTTAHLNNWRPIFVDSEIEKPPMGTDFFAIIDGTRWVCTRNENCVGVVMDEIKWLPPGTKYTWIKE